MTIRLNLGCGDDHCPDWVNVDLRPSVADVVCDVRKLGGWADDSVEEIRAMDLLEHFPADQTHTTLAEWARVLRPGGTLTVKVPNLAALTALLRDAVATRNWSLVRTVIRNIYGGHRWGPEGSLDAHHWGFVPETLHIALREAGFDVISDDLSLNNTVVARKREDP